MRNLRAFVRFFVSISRTAPELQQLLRSVSEKKQTKKTPAWIDPALLPAATDTPGLSLLETQQL